VDDDVIAEAGLARAYVRYFDANPSVSAAGGRIDVQFEGEAPDWISPRLMPLMAHHDLGDREVVYRRGRYPIGANMCFRKSVFEKIGMFDPSLGRTAGALLASEEKDMFMRLAAAGGTVAYVPGARLRHRIGTERLTDEFVRRQALGIGQSERMRINRDGRRALVGKVGSEAVKAAGTLVLSAGYLVRGRTAKAMMLVRFRTWVWQGLLNR
jgi:glucosyl-dolichyl phosphate glucuronosyltransferase